MESALEGAPVGNGLLEPLVLFFGQSDTNGLAFDFAGPRITRTAPGGAAVLDGAFTNPAGIGQLSTEAGIFFLAGGARRFFLVVP